MNILELIHTNGEWVTRKNLVTIFGPKVGEGMYNIGFTAFDDTGVNKRVVWVPRVAKVEQAKKVCIDFNALLKYVGNTAVRPQSPYSQGLKSHELWSGRLDYVYNKLGEHHLLKYVAILKQAVAEAQENEE